MTFSLGLFSIDPAVAVLFILLLIIGFISTSYFVYQRLKLKKMRLVGVLVLNTIAALTITGLAFDAQVINNQASVVYLITNGTDAQQLKQIDKEQPVFVMRDFVKPETNSNILDMATLIDAPSQILTKPVTLDNLHVLGDGLNSNQWQNFNLLMAGKFTDISVDFSASEPRVGLVNIQWPRELAVGQFVEIKGQLQGTDESTPDRIYQLSLLDPVGKAVETIRLKASERFTLSFPAKTIGQWVYRLKLNEPSNNTFISNEPVAFSVIAPSPLRILIKQSAPSFETRQLKNWAADFGSQISVLTQISQNKDIRQNINLSAIELDQVSSPFTEQSLNYFDWLVIDGRALLTLTIQHMSVLQTAVKKGLGVYIIVDNELANAWPVPSLEWLVNISIQPLELANYSSIPIWPNSNIEQAIPLVKAQITADDSFLVSNNEAQILVSQSKIGFGQVAVSLINSTYGWQTSGMSGEYSYYWQSIISELARPKRMPYWLDTPNGSLSLLNQPEKRCLLSASDTGVVTQQNQHTQTLLMTQDMLQTERNCLVIWPTKNAWQKLTWSENKKSVDKESGKTSLTDTWFYTYSEQDWSEWQQTQKHHASQTMAQQHNTKLLEKQATKSLDKIWFWGLLVLSMSMLWLERKLY